MDAVDLVLGNTQKGTLVEQISQVIGLPLVTSSTDGPQDKTSHLRTRAMVKIQEGCNQICAYCIVPKVRGRERSLHPDLLVAQIRRLVDEGYLEVVLTGTQLGSYGFDVPGASLAGLIGRILTVTSVPRLRVSSIQPQELTSELVDMWANPRLCPHFHIPLQSGSAAVLNAMRRRYSPQQYLEAVEAVKQRVPRAAVTTDVIVGFPGETPEQFRETYELCQGIRFARVHIFPFSTRQGTTPAYLKPKLYDQEKRARMVKMLALAKEQAHSYRNGLLGSTCEVLWETNRAAAGGRVWTGLTDNYIRVASGSRERLDNRITQVLLERQEGKLVWGKIVS